MTALVALETFTDWAEDTSIFVIASWIVGVTAVATFLWKTNRALQPFIRSVREFLEDWRGDPGRPGITEPRAGVVETLADHGKQLKEHGDQLTVSAEKLAAIESQVTPNHGSTSKLTEEVQGIAAELAKLTQRFDEHLQK